MIMLKKMSAALLAVSLLAVPALAASPAQTTATKIAAANPAQTTTGIAKSSVGKPQVRKVARHHRHKHRHFARYHKKVSAMHASVRTHGPAKTRLGLNKASHIKKSGHKVGFNTMRKSGAKLSFKRVTPATRRG
jgi:hypothetical protein